MENKKIHPIHKLKNDYNHLTDRTLELFSMGKRRENELETAVVNAWNQLGNIIEQSDIFEIQQIAGITKSYLAKILSKETGKYTELENKFTSVSILKDGWISKLAYYGWTWYENKPNWNTKEQQWDKDFGMSIELDEAMFNLPKCKCDTLYRLVNGKLIKFFE